MLHIFVNNYSDYAKYNDEGEGRGVKETTGADVFGDLDSDSD